MFCTDWEMKREVVEWIVSVYHVEFLCTKTRLKKSLNNHQGMDAVCGMTASVAYLFRLIQSSQF